MDRFEKRRLRLPPSGLSPAAMAMASTRVDFPLPFSPTKNVTGADTSSASRELIAGIENGNVDGSGTVVHLNLELHQSARRQHPRHSTRRRSSRFEAQGGVGCFYGRSSDRSSWKVVEAGPDARSSNLLDRGRDPLKRVHERVADPVAIHPPDSRQPRLARYGHLHVHSGSARARPPSRHLPRRRGGLIRCRCSRSRTPRSSGRPTRGRPAGAAPPPVVQPDPPPRHREGRARPECLTRAPGRAAHRSRPPRSNDGGRVGHRSPRRAMWPVIPTAMSSTRIGTVHRATLPVKGYRRSELTTMATARGATSTPASPIDRRARTTAPPIAATRVTAAMSDTLAWLLRSFRLDTHASPRRRCEAGSAGSPLANRGRGLGCDPRSGPARPRAGPRRRATTHPRRRVG